MKNFTYFFILLLISKASYSQCSSGYVLTVVSDTVSLVSNGDSSGVVTLPKFDASLGTLIAATIKCETQSSTTYSITNNGSGAALYKSRFIKVIELVATELAPDNPTFTNLATSLNAVINPGETQVWGPTPNNYSNSMAIPVAHYVNLLGPGTFNMNFSNTYSCSVTGPVPYSLSFLDITDTTKIIISYSYCNAIALPLNWVRLRITEKNNNPELSWTTTTENVSAFLVERAEENKDFKPIKSIEYNPTSYYAFQDQNILPNKNYLYRIKVIKSDNSDFYSDIIPYKTNINKKPKISRYGNVLLINNPDLNNYKVEILTIDGRLVYTNQSIHHSNHQITISQNITNSILVVKLYNSKQQLISISKL